MTYEEIKEIVARDVKVSILTKLGRGNWLAGINHLTAVKLKETKGSSKLVLTSDYTKTEKGIVYANSIS